MANNNNLWVRDHVQYKDFPDWLSKEAKVTLDRGYLLKKGEKLKDGTTLTYDETPFLAYHRVAKTVNEYYPKLDILDDLLYCLYQGWIGLATPVFSNFGAQRGLPISCFLTHLGDSIDSIYGTKLTVAQMSKNGGGVATYFGDIRPEGSPISNGGTSSNVKHWIKEYDLTASVVTQGNVRRGSIAAYIDIDHPDLADILMVKDHSQGDPRGFIDCNLAVNINDKFMYDIINGDKHKKEILNKVLEMRVITGSPYIVFIDTVNKDNPLSYKELGLDVSMSNLCSEIMLHTSPEYAAVCCLSSMNLAKWDEWRCWQSKQGHSAVQLAIILLDAVLQEFIDKAKHIKGMEPAVAFSKKSRALGLGVQGLHYLYQSKMYPFASKEARELNIKIHKQIQTEAVKASKLLGKFYGIPEWCKADNRRNSHLLAIAPTRTNSVITGAFTPGIEPMEYNYYVAKQNKSTFVRKNRQLEKIINKRFSTNEQDRVWQSILDNKGSIAHLTKEFTPSEREVFKTARELDQLELIRQAGDRQKFICQSQSLNLFSNSEVTADDLYEHLIYAWIKGVKSLYYFKGKSLIADREIKDKYVIITKQECPYCIKLKKTLTKEGRAYKEIPLDKAKQDGLWEDDWQTVPQLFINGVRIGGYDTYTNTTTNECLSCEG